jgi:transcriptional regulator with XRE-family HTH domain
MTAEERFESALRKNNISRQAAADRLGVSLSAIAMYCAGQAKIRKVVALAVQAELGISAEWILSGKAPMMASASRPALPPEALEIGAIFDELPRARQADAALLLTALSRLKSERDP